MKLRGTLGLEPLGGCPGWREVAVAVGGAGDGLGAEEVEELVAAVEVEGGVGDVDVEWVGRVEGGYFPMKAYTNEWELLLPKRDFRLCML